MVSTNLTSRQFSVNGWLTKSKYQSKQAITQTITMCLDQFLSNLLQQNGAESFIVLSDNALTPQYFPRSYSTQHHCKSSSNTRKSSISTSPNASISKSSKRFEAQDCSRNMSAPRLPTRRSMIRCSWSKNEPPQEDTFKPRPPSWHKLGTQFMEPASQHSHLLPRGREQCTRIWMDSFFKRAACLLACGILQRKSLSIPRTQ